MNRHDHISAEHLTALFDDELPPDEAAEVRRHVTSCAECLETLADMERTRQAAQMLPDYPVSDEVWHRIEGRLPQKARVISLFSRVSFFSRPVRQWAMAAAVVVAIAIGALIATGSLGPFSERGPATVQHRATNPLAFDYGLYLAALTEPVRMQQFVAKYNRRQVTLQQALAALDVPVEEKLLAEVPAGLDLKAVYVLDNACCQSVQVTYQHNGSEVILFRQPKGLPVQFAGYEIEPAAVGGKHCLMVDSGRYCAITFSTEQAQYVVIGRRDDPMVAQVIGGILKGKT